MGQPDRECLRDLPGSLRLRELVAIRTAEDDASAIAKGSLVLVGALALSWGVVAAIRRIPAVARLI